MGCYKHSRWDLQHFIFLSLGMLKRETWNSEANPNFFLTFSCISFANVTFLPLVFFFRTPVRSSPPSCLGSSNCAKAADGIPYCCLYPIFDWSLRVYVGHYQRPKVLCTLCVKYVRSSEAAKHFICSCNILFFFLVYLLSIYYKCTICNVLFKHHYVCFLVSQYEFITRRF